MRYFITGATGFLGGHVAEGCVGRGHAVCALARAESDSTSLERWGVAIHRTDLKDVAGLRNAVAGAQVVVHCAAKVGDWGPVEEYRAVNVEGLRRLLDACREIGLKRFVHISSLGVYAARHHHRTDESEPLPAVHIDGYTQSKIEAEQLALQYQREHRVPVVVLRPGFIYGPRDRTVLPVLIQTLRGRKLIYLGSTSRALNTIFVRNLVEAVFLAVEKPEAVGQVYNLTDGEPVSKRRFIEAIVGALGLPRPWPVPLPLWLARVAAWSMEGCARWLRATSPPPLTQARLKFLGLNLDFSIEKARRELRYQPPFTFDRGMEETMAWYKENA